MKRFVIASVLTLLIGTSSTLAQEGAETRQRQAQKVLDALHYQQGDIALAKANAHLQIGPGFRFLGHDDARHVLEDLWGNPPDDSILGLIVPDNAPLGSEHSWAVVVTYSDDGYVSDEDAAKIDYAQMLKDMQKATLEANPERKKQGYPSMELLGWAQPPHYDSDGKRLLWAKEFSVQGGGSHALNYDIRVLGRGGFLSLNALASIDDLDLVKDGMPRVLPMAQFDAGHRYADFKPGQDKLAGYGLAALVGGGIAAKAGLFAKLGVLLLAFKKFAVLIFIGIGAVLKQMFGKKGRDEKEM